jgi:phosphohistidine phosphatase
VTTQKTPKSQRSSPTETRVPLKTLSLIRHAKSSWKYAQLDDQDRPLNGRGVRDSALMGMVLSQRGYSPSLIVSSPALRAIRTAEALAAAIGYPETGIVLDRRLYHAGASQLMDLARQFDDALDWVACVGHNPGLTDLVGMLVDKGPDNVPTCAVVDIRFNARRWQEIDAACVIDFVMDKPKLHK